MLPNSFSPDAITTEKEGFLVADKPMDVPNDDVQRWRSLALRRLDRLVDAEHDLDRLRDRLQQSQIEINALLAQRQRTLLEAQRLSLRVIELEGERSAWMASRGWRLLQRLHRVKGYVYAVPYQLRRVVRYGLRVSWLRPVKSLMIHALPGLSLRIHTRLRAGD